jgi:hypothetical protein
MDRGNDWMDLPLAAARWRTMERARKVECTGAPR